VGIERVYFHDQHSRRSEFESDVLAGLSQRPATVPPKYFYDSQGSRLFDAITELPEYYLTRTEVGILSANAAEIAQRVGTGSLLVEPGGGSCDKVHILLAGLKPLAYVPMDISKDHLRLATEQLSLAFPWLEIHAACTDYCLEMKLPPNTPKGTRVAFFPGSSIGNFDPEDAVNFLVSIAELVGPEGYLLIGVDLKKDQAILEAAYADAAGVTAAFNLNLLARINLELGGDFDLGAWQHQALYNEQRGRIEMHLVSQGAQTVTVNQRPFHFAAGETIHTENSYKYSRQEFIALAARAGFQSDALWCDDQQLFSVHLFRQRREIADA
jgi:dimethylhistidine N-methyltransferase